ncbi:head-tail adaptor protein, partial [Ventosimonas gracilis]
MQAGKLRHRVEIQRAINSQDAQSGANIEAWQTIARVWASLEPLSARDFIAAQAAQNQITARAVIRYRKQITAGMRLIHASGHYL